MALILDRNLFLKIDLIYVSFKVQSQHELKLHINDESNMLLNAVTDIYPCSLLPPGNIKT